MAADTRERILASCARVIARTGLARFRMSEVAREAGVSIGLLAYHFGDRDGLLQAALDEVT
ncbi:TetR/AcrR family transcriptional regulator, partial [Leucobacter sp. M11]|uniref:TetR/AcrR family transcriptional regulator n=1 Tax=Leucobacter sp. M11 TaxID=2993565 RepID=UPI002D80F552